MLGTPAVPAVVMPPPMRTSTSPTAAITSATVSGRPCTSTTYATRISRVARQREERRARPARGPQVALPARAASRSSGHRAAARAERPRTPAAPISTTAIQSDRRSKPMLNPIASSSRLIETPSARSRNTDPLARPATFSLSSSSSWTSIHTPNTPSTVTATSSAASPMRLPTARPSSSPSSGITISKLDITRLTPNRSRRGRPRIPSAAETANVSNPSGSTNKASFTTAARG